MGYSWIWSQSFNWSRWEFGHATKVSCFKWERPFGRNRWKTMIFPFIHGNISCTISLSCQTHSAATPWWVSDDSLTLVSEKAGSMRRANKAYDSRYYLVCQDEKRLAGQYGFWQNIWQTFRDLDCNVGQDWDTGLGVQFHRLSDIW